MFFKIYIEKVEAEVSEVSEVSSLGVSAETSEIYEISQFGLFDTKFGVVPFRRGCRFNCFGWDRGCHWVWFQASVCKAGRPTKVPFGYEIVLWVLFVLFVLSVLTRSFVGFVSVRAVALGAGVVSEWLS
jgi:hypothetical protein